MRSAEAIKQLFGPNQTLSQRVVRGGIWVFGLRIASRALTLMRTIVVARVLAPGDFGLMGIALLAMSALETFSQTGFQAALIQKKEDIRDYLDTGWTVSALRGLVLFAVLYLAAPYIALFFNTPAATPIMRVIGISMLLNGLTNIGVVYFQKELEFNKQFVYQLSGTVADLVVAITAALLLQSVWALVFGLLAGNFVRFVMSYMVHPYRPQVRFEAGRAKELYGFGRWVFGSSVLFFLVTQGDDIFMGKLLGVVALGFYQMAYRVGNLPTTELVHVIAQVSFPAYSKLQDKTSKLREGFLRVLNVTSLISIPLAGGIFMLAPEFTRIFLGDKWMPMVSVLRVLIIGGMIRAIIGTGGSLFSGVGKPDLVFKMTLARLSVMAVSIYPLTLFWGITGTALSVTLGCSAPILLWVVKTMQIAKIALRDYLELVFLPIFGTVVMCLVILLSKALMEINCVSFIFIVTIALIAYLLFITSFYHFNSEFLHRDSFVAAWLSRLAKAIMMDIKTYLRTLEALPYFYEGRLITQLINDEMRKCSIYATGRLLDIGCGSKPYRKCFVNVNEYIGVDLTRGEKDVDVVAGALNLPFRQECFDTALSTQVLEHVPDPEKMIAEINYVLKEGGYLILTAPQTGRIHGEPHDYYRFTKYGLKFLLENNGFAIEYLKSQGGFWLTVGQLSCFYIQFNAPRLGIAGRVCAKILIVIISILSKAMDNVHYWDLDTLGYTIVGKKQERVS